jgi:glucose/mannose-6-phosphate isomerase
MFSTDKSGYKALLLNFYKQIEESARIFEEAKINLKADSIHNILYLGMGGSAVAGNLLYDILFDQLKVPLDVVRSYFAPSYCTEDTLVIASSYSGNTEETLSSLEKAAETGAQIIVITSGGKIEEIAPKNGWGLISIPKGFPPRQALGYLFFPLYHLFGRFGLINDYQSDLNELIKFVQDAAKRNDYPNINGRVLSKELAQMIYNKVPILYSTAPYLKSVSIRWQNQIQENAKSLAFSNVLPELNHNEILGWEQGLEALKNFIVIFLENEQPHPRIKKRIELTKNIIKERGIEVVDIYSAGGTIMEKVFSVIILGDWVSYYLAMAYKKDPVKIDNIDFLKTRLAQMEN